MAEERDHVKHAWPRQATYILYNQIEFLHEKFHAFISGALLEWKFDGQVNTVKAMLRRYSNISNNKLLLEKDRHKELW